MENRRAEALSRCLCGAAGTPDAARFAQSDLITSGPYYDPDELEKALRDFVAYDNHERYHESLDSVTPADVYFGRQYEFITERNRIKKPTMRRRKKEYLAANAAWVETKNSAVSLGE